MIAQAFGPENGYEISTSLMQMMQLTRKLSKKIKASYSLEGTVLENVDNIKCIGVTSINDLRWNTHISTKALEQYK